MEIQAIKIGIIISGPKWPEPVEIKRVDHNGDYVHIVGATTLSNQHIDQLIPLNEFSDISIRTIDTDFKSEAWKVFLALESKRYRFASLYDPLLAMNSSKVDPLPHQIEAVYGYFFSFFHFLFLCEIVGESEKISRFRN